MRKATRNAPGGIRTHTSHALNVRPLPGWDTGASKGHTGVEPAYIHLGRVAHSRYANDPKIPGAGIEPAGPKVKASSRIPTPYAWIKMPPVGFEPTDSSF